MTREEILKVTGWKAVNVQQVAEMQKVEGHRSGIGCENQLRTHPKEPRSLAGFFF
jgi:hypothetical protein